MRVPRRYESSTSQLSSTTSSPWRSAMARMASQSGQLPTRLGVRIALVRGPIIASILVTSICSVSGSTSTNAGTMPLRTSGAMSLENVSGDVMTSSPGSQPEQVDGQPQRRRPAVHHHRVLLGEQLGAPPLELGDLGPDGETPGALQDRDDGVDLALVVDGAGFGDGGIAHLTHDVVLMWRAYRGSRWSSNPSLR